MTYATITLLHQLLEKHLDALEDQFQDSERALEDAIAANGDAAQEGDKEAVGTICNAEDNNRKIFVELKEATAAMTDFQKHDWH